MIGPRCLGPGGSVVRSSSARAPSVRAASCSTAPLAECSYRTWQAPPLLGRRHQQTRTDAPSCKRSLSSGPNSRRNHLNSPHVAISVDQNGIESILYNPPSSHAKLKRLRPVGGPTPDLIASGTNAPPPSTHDSVPDTAPEVSLPGNNVPLVERAKDELLHPPDSALAFQSALKPSASRSHPNIPAGLLVDYLTASDNDAYRKIRARLPSGFHRIDAYLLLRESDPQSLSALSYFDIFPLIRRAGKDDLGGVLALLLEDIVGPDTPNAKAKHGFFQIFAGTEERYKLLREILVRCNRGNFLLHDGTALQVFMLMLDDLAQLRRSSANDPWTNADMTSASGGASSTAESATIALPTNFPIGETRRLVKLAVHLHSPELAPILNAMRAHLEAHTPDFPTAREGAQLIAYYLQPNLREFGTALDIIRGLRDTNALAQEVVDDSIRDGRAYLAELQAMVSSSSEEPQDRTSDEDLQQICLDVSLRLIAMKSLMAHRPRGGVQYRKALESLIASFRLDLVDSQGSNAHSIRSLLDIPFRSIRSIFLHLIGQNDKSCLTEAVFLLQRCDRRLVAMLQDSDLREYCDVARANDGLRLAAETYSHFVRAKAYSASTAGMPADCKHMLARDGLMIDTDTFLMLMQELLSHGQKITIAALLRALRLLPLTDFSLGQLSMRFSSVQRSRLVALLAKAGLIEEAFDLFQHWSQWRYDADSADSTESITLRRAGSVQIVDPLIDRQIRLMHDTDRQVAISTNCLIALVHGICLQSTSPKADGPTSLRTERSPNETAPASTIRSERYKKARFMIDVFKQACTPMDWTHYRLTALARACFIAKDVQGAFDALAKISFLRQIPDQIDIAVLLGGLVEHDADRAVDLFIRHCSIPETIGTEEKVAMDKDGNKGGSAASTKKVEVSTKGLPKLAPMKPTSALTSMLISRAVAQNRMDLADKLYEFSQAVGISSLLGHAASLRTAFRLDVTPSKVIKIINRMLQNGWTADPASLEKLAQRLLSRSMPRLEDVVSVSTLDEKTQEESAPKIKSLSPKKRLHLVQAATYLMQISAHRKDVVNLRTVERALDAIANVQPLFAGREPVMKTSAVKEVPSAGVRAARQRGQDEGRMQLISSLDTIVHLLRWTKLFDTGDDYRQSLSLWKSSYIGNGELVPADLDEMLDHGFSGRHRRSAGVQTSAATATTLPTSAESSSEHHDERHDPRDTSRSTQTNGVMQQLTHRSPNVLPSVLFRRLIESYLALGDLSGAAEVASWMRDEAKVDIAPTPQETSDFVSRIKATVLEREAHQPSAETQQDGILAAAESGSRNKPVQGCSILRMLAGQQSTAHTKSWWFP